MSSYVWAVGFDWNETRHAADGKRLLATMCLSLGNEIVHPVRSRQLYPVDCKKGDALDLSLFDRTDWRGAPPGADEFAFSFCEIVFERSKNAPPSQRAESPVGVKSDLATDLTSDLSIAETTPCFRRAVPHHAWDGGEYPLLHNGLFELTISFDVTLRGRKKAFRKDPEMEVSGVSG